MRYSPPSEKNMPKANSGVDKRLLRTRIGEPGSSIMPGDPTPGGGVYRGGQFAPTMDELSSLSLAQANEAGLLSRMLPIYDGAGNVSEDALEEWKPSIGNVHIHSDVPKYSAAVIVDAFQGKESMLDSFGMTFVGAGTREEQDSLSIYGETVIKAEYVAKNGFSGRLIVYPSFYKYVSAPLVGKIPGRDEGLSVASYAVFHALGHLLFARLMFDGKLKQVAELLDLSGWSKQASNETASASYIEYKHDIVWKRGVDHRNKTEASKFSPMDDFAETFALYFTNQKYLETAFPKRLELIEDILKEYGHNVL